VPSKSKLNCFAASRVAQPEFVISAAKGGSTLFPVFLMTLPANRVYYRCAMGSVLSKIEGIIGRVRLWVWLANALIFITTSGTFAWLAQKVTPIAAYGLAAVILTGTALACLALLALGVIGIAWSLRFRPQSVAEESNEIKSRAANQYMSDAIIVSGRDETAPSFRGRFARNGREGMFYIEYSGFFGGSGGGWSTPITLPIPQHVPRFTQGQTVSIPLLRSVQTREGARWQFGEEMRDGFPVHMVGGGSVYRGRVKFLSEDDIAQSCYFVALSHADMSIMPDVLGEHVFSHAWEWEGKVAPNGNAASLFTPA
jgi:hypothetical protein